MFPVPVNSGVDWTGEKTGYNFVDGISGYILCGILGVFLMDLISMPACDPVLICICVGGGI